MKSGSRIGLVRTDLTGAGGAERYSLAVLNRLAEIGCETHVFTARLPAGFSAAQAHFFRPGKRRLPRMLRHRAFEAWLRDAVPACNLDFLLSLERVLPSDIFRAGDGVHRVWRDLCLRELSLARRFALQTSPAHAQMLRAEAKVFNPKNTRLVICNSQMVADEIVRFYPFPAERIRVVPNGVDREMFQPLNSQQRAALRAERGFSQSDCIALFAGSGFWRKGVDLALRIVERWRALNPNVTFVVVGRAENHSFAQLSEKLGINSGVLFVGAQPPQAMREWYQIADVFLFPTRYDPFANACLEAAACGVPVITTRANGFTEHVVHGEKGLIIQPENAEESASVINDFYQFLPDPESVRASVAHLSLASHVEKLLGVFDDAAQFPLPEGLRRAR